MKTLLLSIAISVFSVTLTQAQINLVGASVNGVTGKIDLVQWEALDSLSVTTTPTILDAYFYATSAFNAFSGDYYITGISGDSSGLYTFNTATAEENLTAGSLFTNVAEFDMSNGKMYNLIMETEEVISIYEFDITSNEDSLIGTIYEPGVIGIVTDAVGFDSNNGILYYVGYTNDPATCLYAIPVRDSVFSYTKTILNPVGALNNITCVHFDNVNETIYALNDKFDSLFNFTGRYIIEIDIPTGDIIDRGDLAEFPYYIGGSSCFDQITGTYLLAAIDTAGYLKMVAFNTATDTYEAGFIPNVVSEIVCDNTLFSKSAYASTAIQPSSNIQIDVFPNPVTDKLNITYPFENQVNVRVTNSAGQLVFAELVQGVQTFEIDMRNQKPGLYLVNLIDGNQTISKKFIVQ